MDLSSLRMFQAVAEARSVTGAAERLHRVQSNVTARVLGLERELGVKLFQRQPRGVVPTPAGNVPGRTRSRPSSRTPRLASCAAETRIHCGPCGARRDPAPAGLNADKTPDHDPETPGRGSVVARDVGRARHPRGGAAPRLPKRRCCSVEGVTRGARTAARARRTGARTVRVLARLSQVQILFSPTRASRVSGLEHRRLGGIVVDDGSASHGLS